MKRVTRNFTLKANPAGPNEVRDLPKQGKRPRIVVTIEIAIPIMIVVIMATSTPTRRTDCCGGQSL